MGPLGRDPEALARLADAIAVPGPVEFCQRVGRVVLGAAGGDRKIRRRPVLRHCGRCQRQCHQRGGQDGYGCENVNGGG